MTTEENEMLRQYLVNQALRLESEASEAFSVLCTRKDIGACIVLLGALYRKQTFDKFSHDLCALLHI